MFRTHWTLLALMTAGFAGTLPAHADPTADTQQQIQRAYDRRDAALNRFDVEGYLASYSSTYKNVTGAGPSGTTDRQRQRVIGAFQHAQQITRHETVQSVIPYGDGVTVMTTAVTTHFVTDAKTGRSLHRIDTDHDRAFWIHTKMGWRIQQERTLSSE